MTATTTPGLGITHLVAGQAQPEVTVNAAFERLDAAAAQEFTHAVATDANYTLATGSTPQPEWIYKVVQVTDTGATLSTGRDIIVPAREKQYHFVNRTAQALTVKTATGNGIAVAGSRAAILQCDGTNVFRITADSTVT